MAFNYYATGAYLLPRFNTGLVTASSKIKRGDILEVVDLDTKAQAVEAGAHPRDAKALDGKMFRNAHGIKQPATLHEDELEYQEGWKERRARLERQFTTKPPLTFTGNGHGSTAASVPVGGRTRPEEID